MRASTTPIWFGNGVSMVCRPDIIGAGSTHPSKSGKFEPGKKVGSTPNEKALCEAVIQLVEDDLEAIRSGLRRCDNDQTGRQVDCRFRVGDQSFAIEHTIVESFPGQIGLEDRFVRFAEGMECELRGTLPLLGIYYLNFEIAPTRNHRPAAHAGLRKKIINWARSAAAELHQEFPVRGTRHDKPQHFGRRESVIDGVRVWLNRRVIFSESERNDGRVFVGRIVDELDEGRRQSIAKAIGENLGKLARCADDGDKTFLILENQDGQLGNHIEIARAIEPLLVNRTDWPDVIFVADTCAGDNWSLWPIVKYGKMALETCHHIDFDGPTLIAASGDETL